MQGKLQRENNFGLLHFIGACMVVYGHIWFLCGSSPPGLLGDSVNGLGVKMIFVITGFLITQSFMRSTSLWDFLKRRLIRIFPAFIFCILTTTIALSSISYLNVINYFRWSFPYILHNLLLFPFYSLPGVFETNPYPVAVNGSLWTLPVEVFAYFVIGMSLTLLKLLKKKTARLIYFMFVCSVFGVVAVWQMQGTVKSLIFWGTDWYAALNLIIYMLIGSLFEIANLKKYCNIQLASVLLLIACCIKFQHIQLLTLIVLPYFTISFALSGKRFSSFFEKFNISYGIYLWHFPIGQFLAYCIIVVAEKTLSPNLMFALCYVPTGLVATFSHFFIENPVEQFLKKNLLKGKTILNM